MPRLLRIDSAIDLENSRTRMLTSAFTETWMNRGEDFTVVQRDLHRNPLPHLPAFELHWAEPLRQGPVPAEAEALQREVIDELLSADVVVIGAPKYNYAMASTLKAWIDHVHVPGATAGGAQPMKGRPVVIATAQGVLDDADDPSDEVTRPLELILHGALGMAVHAVRTSRTLAGRLPGLDPDGAQRELGAALARVRELAATL